MRNATKVFLSAVCLGLGISATTLVQAEDKKPTAPGQPTPEQMEKMVKAGTPGEHHKRLEMMAGTFDAAMSCYGPMQMPPSKGVTKNTMILGGRWLSSEFAGEMMGQKYEGHGLMGYDNTAKKFVGTWVDSMGTQMANFEGTADAAGMITVASEGIDPMTDQKMKMRMTYVIQDKDKHTFTMYMPGPDGKEAKMMEIVYTRVK